VQGARVLERPSAAFVASPQKKYELLDIEKMLSQAATFSV